MIVGWYTLSQKTSPFSTVTQVLSDFNNLWQSKAGLLFFHITCLVFLHHPAKHQNVEIASLHPNAVLLYKEMPETHLNYCLCNKQGKRMERGTQPSVVQTFAKSVSVRCHVNNGSCSSMSMEWKSMDSVVLISYCLNKRYLLSDTVWLTVLWFSRTVHQWIRLAPQFICCSTKLSTSFIMVCDFQQPTASLNPIDYKI